MDKHVSRLAIEQLVSAIHSETKNCGVSYYRSYSYIWDIFSALRGPDEQIGEEGRRLKLFTTARIRGVLQIKDSIAGTVLNRPLTLEERIERDELLEYANYHFVNHYHCAVEAIKVLYNYDLSSEEKIKCK